MTACPTLPALPSRAAAAIALLGAALACAAAPPARVFASYDLIRNGQQIGVVEETFEQTGERYSIVSEARATGLAALFVRGTQRVASRGTVTATGLRPEHFEGSRGDDPSRRVSALFDWDARQLALAHDGKTETLPLAAGTQDRLSVMYQFMYLPVARLGSIEFEMTNGSKVEHYLYQVEGKETADTPLARFATIKFSKRRSGDENSAEVWLAEERNYFPVRLVIAELNGDRLEQVLTRLDFD